jgi:hypothetical protein
MEGGRLFETLPFEGISPSGPTPGSRIDPGDNPLYHPARSVRIPGHLARGTATFQHIRVQQGGTSLIGGQSRDGGLDVGLGGQLWRTRVSQLSECLPGGGS